MCIVQGYFILFVSSILLQKTTLVAFLAIESRPPMVEWYIWKVGWFRVFGCSSSRGASALPQITILTLTSLFKTDISLHPLEQQCREICKQTKKAKIHVTEDGENFTFIFGKNLLIHINCFLLLKSALIVPLAQSKKMQAKEQANVHKSKHVWGVIVMSLWFQ